MSQTSFDEDQLFDEAADEIKQEIESSLENAEETLPEGEEFIEVEGNNLIGILNSFKTRIGSEKPGKQLREAKKSLEIGKRSEALNDEYVEKTEEKIGTLAEIQSGIEEAEARATELTDAVVDVKNKL
ncbi:MAG: DUF5790 family protein [Halobacteria archaeon]